MSRTKFAGILLLFLLATASTAVAAEKVDNVFIAGLDAGYYGATGWVGDNFSGGLGGSVFFGYGITRNFAIELDYAPLITSSPSGDDVKDVYDSAYWGGLGQEYSGIGGIGISGKLYPRERFRDADLVTVQPFARLGVMYIPFIWTYKTSAKDAAAQAVEDEAANEQTKAVAAEDYDGFNNLAVNLGGGVDFMLVKWFSLGLEARLWKCFVVGDTINGYKTDDYKKSDFEGSLLYNIGLNATFQW